MSRSLRRAAQFVTLALLPACSTVPRAGSQPDLNDTAWVLSSLPGRTLVSAPRTPTLRFERGTASGSDGCNGYGAPYTLEDGRLTFGERMMSTMIACDPPVMNQGRALADAVLGARTYRVSAGALELLSDDGSVRATFTRQAATLAGTSWRVTGYNTGSQAVRSVLAGTTITMTFAADGRASGSAGCNTFSGPYTHEGDRLSFGPAAATKKMCAQPTGIMEQEQQFLRALETVASVQFEGDRLRLRTTEGATALTLQRE